MSYNQSMFASPANSPSGSGSLNPGAQQLPEVDDFLAWDEVFERDEKHFVSLTLLPRIFAH